jgi:squalene-hopene/tetraprenyl-beta-curcumene cyclase
MWRIRASCAVAGCVLFMLGDTLLVAQQASDQPPSTTITPNTSAEPLRQEYSAEAAAAFLDSVAVNWQREQKCFACHTQFVYLLARPTVAWDVPVHRQVRVAAEQIAERDGLQTDDPMRSAESVLLAAALAIDDAQTTGTLHPLTHRALDRMWTLQRDDGTWSWPIECKWPPSEIDEYFGVAMAALAVGVVPGEYRQTPQAQAGLERIRRYFQRTPPTNVYQRAELLWVSHDLDGLMDASQRQAAIDELLAMQRPDGGWALAALGIWQRADGKPPDVETSDSYGTGFAVYVLRMAQLPAQHPQIQRGIAWLKTHQRASGRWYTRSAAKDSKHYITHDGTAWALMALAACGEISASPKQDQTESTCSTKE